MHQDFLKSKEFIGHSGQIFSIDFDGNFIYSASADKFVTRWDIMSGNQDSFAIKFEKSPYSIRLFTNAVKLAVGLENGDLHFFDLIKKNEIKYYQQHKSAIFCLLENTSKNQLYSTDSDGNLAVWNTESLKLELILPFSCGKIRRMMLNSEESKLYLACQDGIIRVLDTTFFNLVDEISCHSSGLTAFALYPENENLLLTGGKDAYLKLWDLETKSCLKSVPAHNYVIYDILFSDSKHFVTISRDKSIKVWDTESFNVVQKIEFKQGGHKHSVNSILKIDEYSFATCSDDKSIKLFSGNGLF
jgi:WD40 repeat protein